MDLLKRYLTDAEQRALLQAARRSTDPLAQRDLLWMRLLIETGARVAELASFTAAQAEAALATGWLAVRAAQRKADGKGRRRAHEYLVTEPVRDCLRGLLALQRQHPAGLDATAPEPLVWGRGGQALSVRSYQARMKLWAREAGLDGRISPHWLRHTRGRNIVARSRAKNPLKVVQLALGHASVASSGVYTQMVRQEYVDALHAAAGGRMRKAAARRAAAAGDAGAAVGADAGTDAGAGAGDGAGAGAATAVREGAPC